MNIVNKLTVRHLKKNKRRTMITIIGVIISVAMIMAVATLGVSFLDLMKRQTMAGSGEWHVQYSDVTKEQIEAIEDDESTGKLAIAQILGYAELPGAENDYKPYLFIQGYDKQGLEQFPVELKEGRLPQAANEVVISEEIRNDGGVDYEIGEEISVNMGQRVGQEMGQPLTQMEPLEQDENGPTETLKKDRSETFTVVGTISPPRWEPSWAPGYTVINYVDRESMAQNDFADAFVAVDKLNRSLYKNAENLAKQNNINIEGVSYNGELLRYQGVTRNDNLRSTLFSLAAIIMAVIIIGSVSLIYNAFAISVSERARHLAMLSSVGATKKQKRDSVFFEGAIIGALSIPIGVVSGILGIAVTFSFLNSFIEEALGISEKLEVIVTPYSVIVACIVSVATIFISTFLPARKASRISAIDGIRQTQDIKLTGKTVKTSKLVRKIFGMEAEIGLKNLKRNKRRYQATVFSLVISIVLFLSVSFFTSNISKSAEMSQDAGNFDIQVSGDNLKVEDLEPLTRLEAITDSSIQTWMNLGAPIEEEAFPDKLHDKIEKENLELEDGKYTYWVNLYGLDEASFQEYANKAGADLESFKNQDTPKAIIIDKIMYEDYDAGRKIIETESIKANPGEMIELVWTEDYDTTLPVEIVALTDQLPMGVRSARIGGLDLIVPQETLDRLAAGQTEHLMQTYLYIDSSDPSATQKALEDAAPSGVEIYNLSESNKRAQQNVMFLSVFTYGFIALMSLISVANIFNTISTSISLRKREFAMLKSVGLTPKGFNKMVNYESIFYGVKALLYGLPISVAVMFLMYRSLQRTFEYGFALPWMSILFVIAAIFTIVGSAMLYSIRKIRKENIIDGLIQENI